MNAWFSIYIDIGTQTGMYINYMYIYSLALPTKMIWGQ